MPPEPTKRLAKVELSVTCEIVESFRSLPVLTARGFGGKWFTNNHISFPSYEPIYPYFQLYRPGELNLGHHHVLFSLYFSSYSFSHPPNFSCSQHSDPSSSRTSTHTCSILVDDSEQPLRIRAMIPNPHTSQAHWLQERRAPSTIQVRKPEGHQGDSLSVCPLTTFFRRGLRWILQTKA